MAWLTDGGIDGQHTERRVANGKPGRAISSNAGCGDSMAVDMDSAWIRLCGDQFSCGIHVLARDGMVIVSGIMGSARGDYCTSLL